MNQLLLHDQFDRYPKAQTGPRTARPRKCETFGCQNPAQRMHQLAPGTNVWLCSMCIYKETKAVEPKED